MTVINTSTAEHYLWGEGCSGWHLLQHDNFSIIEECVPPGQKEQRHFHSVSRQFFYILQGEAIMELDGHEFVLGIQQGIEIPPRAAHQSVGCVLVQDRKIVALGHTQPPGQQHAEAMALSRISGDLSSIAAYVTLEPCSFHGRTPSCAQALVAIGIKQIFVAMLDPDPRNAGTGIQILRDGGIEVSIGLLEEQAQTDLEPYLFHNYPLF